jgi:hypothetical protein
MPLSATSALSFFLSSPPHHLFLNPFVSTTRQTNCANTFSETNPLFSTIPRKMQNLPDCVVAIPNDKFLFV